MAYNIVSGGIGKSRIELITKNKKVYIFFRSKEYMFYPDKNEPVKWVKFIDNDMSTLIVNLTKNIDEFLGRQ
jgi:hypothetical protein